MNNPISPERPAKPPLAVQYKRIKEEDYIRRKIARDRERRENARVMSNHKKLKFEG